MFFPGPVVLSHAKESLCVPEASNVFTIVKPYFASLAQRVGFVSSKVPMNSPSDTYCWSVSEVEFQKRTCPACRIYHASQTSLKCHHQIHGNFIAALSIESDGDEVMSTPSEVLMQSVDEKQD